MPERDPRFFGWQLMSRGGDYPDLFYMKERFASLAERLEKNLKSDRYRALAITTLEEACMWATRSFYSQNGEPEVWECDE